MWLQFLGGAGTVTDSRVLVEHDGGRLLVDCGIFQAGRIERELGWCAVVPRDSERVRA